MIPLNSKTEVIKENLSLENKSILTAIEAAHQVINSTRFFTAYGK
jgi:hypothetical protein